MLKPTDKALQENQETGFGKLIGTFDPDVWAMSFGWLCSG
jgi:hypothetical protein